jgi:hypothetical protein
MSKCHYYHCPHPIACECYGWCEGHRAGLATWLCHHLKPVEKLIEKVLEEKPVEKLIEKVLEEKPAEQPIEKLEEQPVEELEEKTEELPPLPLLRAESLPYYLDKIEEYNEPQELIEQLAKSQTEYNSRIEAEMEDMRKKLAQYEEQKKIVDEIHQLEEKVKTLQSKDHTAQVEKKAILPTQPKRTISIPTTTPRPRAQVLQSQHAGGPQRLLTETVAQVGQKPVLRTQKKL